MIALWLLACGGGGGQAVGTRDVTDYTGLTEGAAWTYRDDGGGDTLPDEDTLVRARHLGDGQVELRRGVSWGESSRWGELVWDDTDGLRLLTWELPDASGSGELLLADADPQDEDRHAVGGWTCLTDATTDVTTWYADFDEVLRFDCEGDGAEGLAGSYWFARDVGLVRLEAGETTLELVGRW